MNVYSFANGVLLINGVEITGFDEGDDVLRFNRLTDSAVHSIGADGRMMVSVSADRSGEVVFKLQAGSNGNKYLMSLLAAMEAFPGRTFVPVNVLWQDLARRDTAAGSVGYLKRPPEVTRGAKATPQEWSIIVERLDLAFGSDNGFGLPAIL